MLILVETLATHSRTSARLMPFITILAVIFLLLVTLIYPKDGFQKDKKPTIPTPQPTTETKEQEINEQNN